MKIIYLLLLSQFIGSTISAQNIKQIDTERSTVKWGGSSLVYFYGHNGTVAIQSGVLVTDGKRITSGSITIDMETIRNTDGDYNQDLVDHLKDPDFFDVANYKTANLEIKNIAYQDDESMECEGILTIKDISQPIKWKASQQETSSGMIFSSKLKIDRSRWDIKYKSKSFFDNLGDEAISDVITFNVKIFTR
ncbi:MAG: YceI family protein [Cyclobacteriaceae bacterium]